MTQRNVLVVDDDDSIRQLLLECLQEHDDLTVDSARDGSEALHRMYSRQYEVVILDLMMPHMSGIDLLDSIQVLSNSYDERQNGNPAVIVVTSLSEELVPTSLLTQRFPKLVRGVLRKPVDIGTLEDLIALISTADRR